VLDGSSFFTKVLKLGEAPQVQLSINKRQYNMGYYLASEIYPECYVFMETMPFPRTEKEQLFARYKEEATRGVQRAFGLLQSRFIPIVCDPIRFFETTTLGKTLQSLHHTP
jgi:hypothetical protein